MRPKVNQRRNRTAGQTTSISDEIVEFLERNSDKLEELPPIINIAFSAERRAEAWHVRLHNKQVMQGFNKSAMVTVMLPLKAWRTLVKKKDQKLWQKALDDGQIHIHGEEAAVAALTRLFEQNGKHNGNIEADSPEEH